MKKLRLGVPVLLVQGVIGTLTVRDLARRTAEQVRGPKWLWRLWGGTNMVGAATYWIVGRRS